MNQILHNFSDKLKTKRSKESGSDVVAVVMLIPIIVILLFTMIDVSYYFQARSAVISATKDGARMTALFGGSSQNIPLNNTGKDTSAVIIGKIWNGVGCIPSQCNQQPWASCTPAKALTLGQQISCRTTYSYKPMSGNLAELIGFGAILNVPIDIVEFTQSETYYNG